MTKRKSIFWRNAALTLLLLASAAPLRANHAPVGLAPHIHAAQMGMGGITTVVASNAHTVFYNPGMLARQSFHLELTLPIGFDNDAMGLVDFIDSNQGAFSDFASLDTEGQQQFMRDAEQYDSKFYGVELAPYVGVAGPGWGLGYYTTLNSNLALDLGVLSPKVRLRGYSDMAFAAGLARSVELAGMEIGAGAAFRYFTRRHVDDRVIDAARASAYQDLIAEFREELVDAESGFGLDVGAVTGFGSLEEGNTQLDVAATIKDLYGSLGGSWIKPGVQAGAMLHVPTDGRLLKTLRLGAELTDMLNRSGASYFQKINMGVELELLAGILALRGGFHQGYPTAGAGLSFGVMRLDIATFTRELGTAPGMHPNDLIIAQLRFGW